MGPLIRETDAGHQLFDAGAYTRLWDEREEQTLALRRNRWVAYSPEDELWDEAEAAPAWETRAAA